MRVRTNDLGVNECRPRALPHVRNGIAQRPITREVVGAVAAENLETVEMLEEAREAAARRLHVDRRRDRVAVVLDEVEHRQLAHAGGVEGLPEFAFARRTFADRDERPLAPPEL